MVEKSENKENVLKSIECTMSPRFGHTITKIHKTKAILFGGATGVEGKFAINSDTYLFYIESKKWVKLDRKFF